MSSRVFLCPKEGCHITQNETKGNHAFVVCTHVDKHHVHNHIIKNSTTTDCTHKFRNFWGSTWAINLSKEHGDMSYTDLQKKVAAATARFNELSEQIKSLESQMNANGEMQKQIVNYAKTRAVYVDYRKAGYSKKFRAEHEQRFNETRSRHRRWRS